MDRLRDQIQTERKNFKLASDAIGKNTEREKEIIIEKDDAEVQKLKQKIKSQQEEIQKLEDQRDQNQA